MTIKGGGREWGGHKNEDVNNHKGLGFQKDDNEEVSTPYMGYNEQNDEDNKNPQKVKFVRGE